MKIARVKRHIARPIALIATNIEIEPLQLSVVYLLSGGVLEVLVNPYPV